MNDNELIQKIKALKQVQPKQDWILATKSQILGKEDSYETKASWYEALFARALKPAFAMPFAMLVLVSGAVIVVSQSSVPGDPLHSIEQITERAHQTVLSPEEKPTYYLSLAEKRVKELKEVVDANKTDKISAGVEGVEQAIKKAVAYIPPKPDSPIESLKVVRKVNNINAGMKGIEDKLEVPLGKDARNNMNTKTFAYIEGGIEGTKTDLTKLSKLVEREITELDHSTLTAQGEKCLEEIKGYYNDYLHGDEDNKYQSLQSVMEKINHCR